MSLLSQIFEKIFPIQVVQAANAVHAGDADPAAERPSLNIPLTAMVQTNVEITLDYMRNQVGDELNWKTSLEDLLLVLRMDSSPATRQALAVEVGYPGDMDNLEELDPWVHREVMRRITHYKGRPVADKPVGEKH